MVFVDGGLLTGEEDASPPCGVALQFQNGIVGIHPGSFRMSGKCRTYEIRKMKECVNV